MFKKNKGITIKPHIHCNFCQRQLIIGEDEIYQIDKDTKLCYLCNKKYKIYNRDLEKGFRK